MLFSLESHKGPWGQPTTEKITRFCKILLREPDKLDCLCYKRLNQHNYIVRLIINIYINKNDTITKKRKMYGEEEQEDQIGKTLVNPRLSTMDVSDPISGRTTSSS